MYICMRIWRLPLQNYPSSQAGKESGRVTTPEASQQGGCKSRVIGRDLCLSQFDNSRNSFEKGLSVCSPESL